ncbi:MAG: hypothetical protein IMF10_07570 [Proteobacteria bacterium]|nr:hypothetical protein [Pseudomonadota bacterium]
MKIIIISIILLAVCVCFKLIIKTSKKSLLRQMLEYVDMVKVTLYKIFRDDLSDKYGAKGKDFYTKLAAAMVNEIFSDHTEESQGFLSEYGAVVVKELAEIGRKYPDIKRPITDALRVKIQVEFMDSDTMSDSTNKIFQKVIEYGLFIEGGEAPNPDSFKNVVDEFAESYQKFGERIHDN